MYRIPLHVENVNLEDAHTFDAIANCESLASLDWSSVDRRVVAVLYCDDNDPVHRAVETARRISHLISGAKVSGVDQDLVGISDIAGRIGVTREAVRKWASGERGPGGFPEPLGSISGRPQRSTRVWAWSSVNAWLQEQLHMGDPDKHLSPVQEAQLNGALRQVEDSLDHAWRLVQVKSVPVSAASPSRPEES